MYYVYLLEDCNGLGYIGSTCRLNIRLRRHRYKSEFSNSKLLAKPFTSLVLEKFEDKDSMMVGEQFYIKLYKSLYGDKLVNKSIPLQTDKEYLFENKDKIRKQQKLYAIKNKDKIKEYLTQYCKENRVKLLTGNKKYYAENKDKLLEQKKIYRDKNIEQTKAYGKKYYDKNIDKIKEYRSQKIECECGSIFTILNKSQHFKSLKHKNFLNLNL